MKVRYLPNHLIYREPISDRIASFVILALSASQSACFFASPVGASTIHGKTTIVAVSGDLAPDEDGIFSTGFSVPALNDVGHVVFRVGLTNTTLNGEDELGIFRADGTTTVEIVRTGQSTPDANGIISDLFPPALNAAGQVAFSALLNGGNTEYAMLRGDGSTLLQLVTSGQPAPDGNGVFSRLSPQPTLNERDDVAFLADLVATIGTNDGSGVFRASEDLIVQLARKGQSTPSGNGQFLNFNNGQMPAMNDSGKVAFFANLTNTFGDFRDDSGMFLADASMLTEIVREGQPAPDGNGTLFPNNAPRLNSAGELAFQTFLLNGAIYRADGVVLTPLARRNEPVPDGNGVFESFNGNPALNDSGQAAFVVELDGTSEGSADDRGIFRSDGNTVTQAVREGSLAPDGNGTFISSIDNPALNDAGQVFFRALVHSSDDNLERGLFLYDDVLGLLQVVREGETLLGSAISELSFADGGSSGHVRSGFNKSGSASAAYKFILADGREGIAIWSLVPEPASGGLVAVAVLSLAGFRGWRRPLTSILN